ncbi:hypothetical protein K1T71_011132 [Dendrolimus kikuchii]|uniref:Uncharacterized protein n=1 Tax=Dendrolimus kikuchii TaxID=765133 RepID=A0ACC1CND1_9NEOP|nr:hypothetical protein K1T71_011132 [Dendrolimus kikuchii]
MSHLLAGVLLLGYFNNCFGKVVPRSVQSFVDHELVPDILNSPPESILSVIFPNGINVSEAMELTPEQVKGVPNLQWNANSNRLYTVVFCDPDAPSREAPDGRSFLHWLVINIPDEDVDEGDTIVNILNSHPEPETGFHRYVFLVYEQPEGVVFDLLPNESFEGRVNFSVEDFASRYNLGIPVAGNFYFTQTIE